MHGSRCEPYGERRPRIKGLEWNPYLPDLGVEYRFSPLIFTRAVSIASEYAVDSVVL